MATLESIYKTVDSLQEIDSNLAAVCAFVHGWAVNSGYSGQNWRELALGEDYTKGAQSVRLKASELDIIVKKDGKTITLPVHDLINKIMATGSDRYNEESAKALLNLLDEVLGGSRYVQESQQRRGARTPPADPLLLSPSLQSDPSNPVNSLQRSRDRADVGLPPAFASPDFAPARAPSAPGPAGAFGDRDRYPPGIGANPLLQPSVGPEFGGLGMGGGGMHPTFDDPLFTGRQSGRRSSQNPSDPNFSPAGLTRPPGSRWDPTGPPSGGFGGGFI